MSPSMVAEIKTWLQLSFWTAIRSMCELLPWLVSLVMVGHVSTEDLAALSLVEVWIYTFLEIIWTGVSVTESVLVSQAHGQKSLLAMRGWTAMSVIVMIFLNVILAVLCLFTSPTLVSFGFEKDVADRGGIFALFIIAPLFTEGMNVCIATYFTSFQLALVPTVLQFCTALWDILFTYMLIFGLGNFEPLSSSLKGSAVGWTCSSALNLIAMLLCLRRVWGHELSYGTVGSEADEPEMKYRLMKSTTADTNHDVDLLESGDNGESTLNDFSKANLGLRSDSPFTTLLGETTHDNSNNTIESAGLNEIFRWIKSSKKWWQYAKQAVPNFSSISFQSLSFFIMSFLAAKLGVIEIASHNTSLALYEVIFTIVAGMSEATAIRIGFHVGRGDVQAAKNVMLISFCVSCAWGVVVGTIGFIFREEIAACISSDPAVISMSVSFAPLVYCSYAVFSVGDQTLAALNGQGRASEEAACSLVGMWLVSVPLFVVSYTCTDFGLRGLWFALILGYIVAELLAAVLIFRSDWDNIVREAVERAEEEEEQVVDGISAGGAGSSGQGGRESCGDDNDERVT